MRSVISQDSAREQAAVFQQMVTFTVGAEAYAVDVSHVQEIIRVPQLMTVPLAPPSLVGLANLRGQVLPLLSLRQLLGRDSRGIDDTTRALVLNMGQPMGFVVDHVLSVIEVHQEEMTPVDRMATQMRRDWVRGVIQRPDGEIQNILVLDFLQMIAQAFPSFAHRRDGGQQLPNDVPPGRPDEPVQAGNEVELVSFDVAGQEYAIQIDRVREIVQFPERVVQIPEAPAQLLGIVPLRRRLIPLINLRYTLGFSASFDPLRARVMVVSHQGETVGLVTDSVREVLRVDRCQIEPMPRLIAQRPELADIQGFCRLTGDRLVGVVDLDRFFKRLLLEEVNAAVDGRHPVQDDEALTQGDNPDNEEQFVVFRVGQEEYGVPIAHVQEIVRLPDRLTRVPHAPDYVEGVINLRGNVLPVLDFRRLLGLDTVVSSERQRVMVFVIQGVRTGFIVDAVAEVLKLPASAIEPAPYLSEAQHAVLGRVANLPEERRMIQLVNVDALVTGDQIRDVTQLQARLGHDV
ncbi:MAG: chemotaxis protein CheW [Firmicutes bacterium]|nr:chemotaxis protein CheW [Bacillota bacterium]